MENLKMNWKETSLFNESLLHETLMAQLLRKIKKKKKKNEKSMEMVEPFAWIVTVYSNS